MQLDALTKFDCDKVFTDKVGSVKQRQGLEEALGYLRAWWCGNSIDYVVPYQI